MEGHGEVSAFPVLLRRLLAEAAIYDVAVGSPIRRHRSEFVDEKKLKAAIQLAKLQRDCGAILVLFDSDGACPKELVTDVSAWAKAVAATIPCEIVIAHQEYEAWLISAMESLRGQRGIAMTATAPTEPESVRDAKGAIARHMVPPRGYAETTDQAALSQTFDMAIAHGASRSFKRLVRAFGDVLQGAGVSIASWPPAGW